MAENTEKIENIKSASSIAGKILIEPRITEEATRVAQFNKYIFKVASSSNKIQVKKAIEELYKVKVTAVNIINIHKKKRIHGKTSGWKSGYKKAIITVKEGDKIEIFEGK